MPPHDPTTPSKWTGFTRRLSYLLFGVALGFVILGLFQIAKDRQARHEEQLQLQLQSQPKPADDPFPPVPRDEPIPAAPPANTPPSAPASK